jgi:hypothetical protein
MAARLVPSDRGTEHLASILLKKEVRTTMENATFQIPVPEEREIGVPDKIEHLCDYELREDGYLEYYYNYIVYQWIIDGKTIGGRAYLDEIDKISLYLKDFDSNPDILADKKFQPILRYLQRRFKHILYFAKSLKYMEIYHRT